MVNSIVGVEQIGIEGTNESNVIVGIEEFSNEGANEVKGIKLEVGFIDVSSILGFIEGVVLLLDFTEGFELKLGNCDVLGVDEGRIKVSEGFVLKLGNFDVLGLKEGFEIKLGFCDVEGFDVGSILVLGLMDVEITGNVPILSIPTLAIIADVS